MKRFRPNRRRNNALAFIVLSVLPLSGAAAGPADLTVEADSLHALGRNLIKAGRYDSARGALEAEVKLRQALGDSTGWADGLNALSEAVRRGGDNQAGRAAAEQALRIIARTASDEPRIAADAHNNIGNAWFNVGDLDRAMEQYAKTLALRLKALGSGDPDVAMCYNNIGAVYFKRGDYQRARAEYEKALALRRATLAPGDPDLAMSYNNIGAVSVVLGDYRQALETLRRALAIRLAALGPDHPDVAASFNNIGVVHYNLGEYGPALDDYSKARTILEKALGPDHPDVAACCNNIGTVYTALGDFENALAVHDRSLAIKLKLLGPDHPDLAASYNNIGNVHEERGDYRQALASHTKALSILEKALGPDHPDLATCYNNIANAYESMGEREKALENHERALALLVRAYGPRHPDVAMNYHNLGAVHYNLGRYDRAFENYRRARSIWLATVGADHPLLAECDCSLGKTVRAQNKKDLALEYFKKSIAVTERVRAGIGAEALAQTYAERVRERYDQIVTLLLEMGRPKEAFEYYERSKSMLLLDELQRQGVDIGSGELKKKIGRFRSLAQQVGVLEQQVLDEKTKSPIARDRVKIENLTRLLARTKGEFFRLVADIRQNPDYAFTVTVDPVQFASLQRELPEGNTLVMYYAARDRLFILTVSGQGYVAKSVAVSKDSLDALVKSFRAAVNGPAETLTVPSTALYDLLILPVEDQVAAATVLTFIPSGNLCYVPLGALARERDGRLRYLIEDKPVSYLTSAELFRCVERKAKPTTGTCTLLIVGNPAGADLPNAAEEAKAIHLLYPGSKLYLGADAKKTAVAGEAAGYQLLHLATHAYINSRNPWDSYIYLVKADTDNGHWTMAEITNETWQRMALVTLSGCQTALGGERPGLELESMARAFSIAGAPSVVATLWPVNDESTKDLMVGFYTNYQSMSKVEALRQAQLSLLKNGTYRHPFFWAPFILIGDGR